MTCRSPAHSSASEPGLTAGDLTAPRRSWAAHKGWARRRRQWEQYLAMHGHAECFSAFVSIVWDLRDEPPELYWKLLSDTWMREEAPSCNGLWRRLWSDRRPGRGAAMTGEERGALAALPDSFTVYRGCGDRGAVAGLSWSLDRELAISFAHRAANGWTAARAGIGHVGDGPPLLVTGEVARGDVLAYLNERQEREIVALAVRVVEVVPVGA